MKIISFLFLTFILSNISLCRDSTFVNSEKIVDFDTLSKTKISVSGGVSLNDDPSNPGMIFTTDVLYVTGLPLALGIGGGFYKDKYSETIPIFDLIFLMNFYIPFTKHKMEISVGLDQFVGTSFDCLGELKLDYNIKRYLSIGMNYKQTMRREKNVHLLQLNLSVNLY